MRGLPETLWLHKMVCLNKMVWLMQLQVLPICIAHRCIPLQAVNTMADMVSQALSACVHS